MIANKETLTATELYRLFSYNPFTGTLRWRVKPAQRIKIGDIAGSFDKRTARYAVSINNKSYLISRVIWCLVSGSWPEREIDHINGIASDNKISNLRQATHSGNQQNRLRANQNNKTGLLGASKHESGGFIAQIKLNGKNKYLGYFHSADEAHNAYVKAKRLYHPFSTL